jgi:hypothetical protein
MEETVMAIPGEDLVTLYDKAPLNARYWISTALAIITSVFDYFDYFLVGFLVAVLAPLWHLTFGQTSIMCCSAPASVRSSDRWSGAPWLIALDASHYW